MKDNAKAASEFENPNRQRQAQMPPQTIKCFVIPIDQMETIRDAVREAPHRVANPVVNMISTMQIMDVPIGAPPDQTQQ